MIKKDGNVDSGCVCVCVGGGVTLTYFSTLGFDQPNKNTLSLSPAQERLREMEVSVKLLLIARDLLER